jgi:hypothetical protein
MTMLFGKTLFMMAGDEEFMNKQPLTDGRGGFTKVPTAEEFAKAEGLNISTEVPNAHLLGKISTISQFIDEEEKDDESNGSGGFCWSF